MHLGYAESSTVTPFIFQCRFHGHAGYETHKEAITELALDMYHKYMDCFDNFDEDDFKEYLFEIHSATAGSYGDAEQTTDRDLKWWPFWNADILGAPKEEIIYIGEYGEYILLDALEEALPDIIKRDDDERIDSDWAKFKQGIQPKYV